MLNHPRRGSGDLLAQVISQIQLVKHWDGPPEQPLFGRIHAQDIFGSIQSDPQGATVPLTKQIISKFYPCLVGYSGTCLNPLAKKKVMGELTYRFGFVGSSPPSTWSQARLNRSSTMRRTCRSSHLETLRSAAFRGRFIPFVAKDQGERGRPNYIDYILYIYIYAPCTRIT